MDKKNTSKPSALNEREAILRYVFGGEIHYLDCLEANDACFLLVHMNPSSNLIFFRKLQSQLNEMDEGKLSDPPSISFTAASGAFCFLAAAVVMWIFTPSALLPIASLGPHWQVFGSQLSQPPHDVATFSLPRPTVALFGKQVDLNRPSLLHGTTFEQWPHRSSYTFSSILGGSKNRLNLEFTALPSCKLDNTYFETRVCSPSKSSVSSHSTPKSLIDIAKANALYKDELAARSMCAHAWLDVSGIISNDFKSFFAPDAVETQAELDVQIGQVEQVPHYALSQRFWLQFDGSMRVAFISNFTLPFPSSSHHLRSSSLYLSDPNIIQLEGASHANVSVVTLHAGEVLAIPPYAVVAAISTSNSSITLKLNSKTSSERKLGQLVHTLPLHKWVDGVADETDFSTEQSAAAIARFLLSESIGSDSGAVEAKFKAIVDQVLNERYSGVSATNARNCGTAESLPSTSALLPEIRSTFAEVLPIITKTSKVASQVAWMDLIEFLAIQAAEDSTSAANILRCWNI